MNLTKAGWCLLIAPIIAGLVLVLWIRGQRRDFRLADGSRLVVEKVIYGKPEPFEYGGWRERWKKRLPPALANRLFIPASPRGSSSWTSAGRIHADEDALYVYITRRDATTTGDFADVGKQRLAFLDEHGCEFVPTQTGGSDDGHLSAPSSGYSVGWFRFEAFPRHEAKLRLRFYGENGKIAAEFLVANPAPSSVPAAHWAVKPLPITVSYGDVSFSLKSVAIKNMPKPTMLWNWSPRIIEPRYEISEGGKESTDWQALNSEFYDSSGNFGSILSGAGFLCTNESAWKLRVKFFGSEKSHSTSNASWILPGLEVPAAGKVVTLNSGQDLQGVGLRVISLAGAGDFEYSNSVAIKAAPLDQPLDNNQMSTSSSSSSAGGTNGTMLTIYRQTVKFKNPQLLVEATGMSDDQRLTARATDNLGREYYAHQYYNSAPLTGSKDKPNKINYLTKKQGAFFLIFDLPADAKTVDVTFCMHGCYTPEFIFKPPAQ